MSAAQTLPPALFSPGEQLRNEAVVVNHARAASQAPRMLIAAAISLTGALGVCALEYELVFRVFDYLGGSEGHWSPKLMACTAASVIGAFHLLAHAHPGHWLVRYLDHFVGVLIPAYLCGLGLLLAAMMYADGLQELVKVDSAFTLFAEPTKFADTGGDWLARFFANVASPLAVIAFAIGLGGISCINIFVAHRLLTAGEQNLRKTGRDWRRARLTTADLAQTIDAQRRYAALLSEIQRLDAEWDDTGIRNSLANDVMSVIAQALRPHKAWLAQRKLAQPERFAQEDGIEEPQVAARVAAIEAVTRRDVMAVLSA